MRFLIDENLPRRMAEVLIAAGHDAEHSMAVLGRSVGDDAIWRWALDHLAIIVTKDDDFLAFLDGEPPLTPLVWLRIGNCSRNESIALVMRSLTVIASAIDAGHFLIEL